MNQMLVEPPKTRNIANELNNLAYPSNPHRPQIFPKQFNQMNFADLPFLASLNVGVEFDKSELKAYWKFDEVSGDIINQATAVGSSDSLGTAADIQITGATYGVTGIINDALSFDGINDFGAVGTSLSQFNPMHSTTALWTISFWMKLNATSRGSFDRIFGNSVGTADTGIYVVLDDSGGLQKLNVAIRNSTGGQNVIDFLTSTDYIPDNTTTWYHYIITYDQSLGSNNLKVYRDNANLEQGTKTANTPTNGDANYAVHLDRLPSGSGNFPANQIDEFSLWYRVITSDERAALYNGGAGLAL